MIRSHLWISQLVRKAVLMSAVAPLWIAGCEQKEEVLDLEAPGVGVEIERSVDDGSLDVDVDE